MARAERLHRRSVRALWYAIAASACSSTHVHCCAVITVERLKLMRSSLSTARLVPAFGTGAGAGPWFVAATSLSPRKASRMILDGKAAVHAIVGHDQPVTVS
eukprot:TRINITY_DN648_c0_g1_i2.p1 TRINITY_DN648_c0_g1~~TRINITY_DN648_c0_g1_i2.p1  ORF type:complete len:102 (+),score=10.35 TRINITY_DN648_c0_g1_i2:591-896(+)